MWLIFRGPDHQYARPLLAAPVIYFNLCGQPSGSPCWAGRLLGELPGLQSTAHIISPCRTPKSPLHILAFVLATLPMPLMVTWLFCG